MHRDEMQRPRGKRAQFKRRAEQRKKKKKKGRARKSERTPRQTHINHKSASAAAGADGRLQLRPAWTDEGGSRRQESGKQGRESGNRGVKDEPQGEPLMSPVALGGSAEQQQEQNGVIPSVYGLESHVSKPNQRPSQVRRVK